MSALEELISQYREKAQIKKTRKRPRDFTPTFVPDRSTKGKTETSGAEVDHVFVEVKASGNTIS